MPHLPTTNTNYYQINHLYIEAIPDKIKHLIFLGTQIYSVQANQ